jgi:osmotically-inducible protein OsmY
MRLNGTTSGEPGSQQGLPDYGAAPPVEEKTVIIERPRRASLGSWLLALGLGAVIAVVVVMSAQDPRSVGTQLDDAVANVRAVGSEAGQALTDSKDAVAGASQGAVTGVNTALSDAAISTKVKAALAVDPALSASRITVETSDGIVRLEGPAPDAAAKDRASVLAGAPQGVRGVDNRLALPQPGQVVTVTESAPIAAPAAMPASAAR